MFLSTVILSGPSLFLSSSPTLATLSFLVNASGFSITRNWLLLYLQTELFSPQFPSV